MRHATSIIRTESNELHDLSPAKFPRDGLARRPIHGGEPVYLHDDDGRISGVVSPPSTRNSAGPNQGNTVKIILTRLHHAYPLVAQYQSSQAMSSSS